VAGYLLILGNRQGLQWVLRNAQMAFVDRRSTAVDALKAGDELLLYTTRGCFNNPTRDIGRVIGTAHTKGAAEDAAAPVVVGGRSYSRMVGIELRALTPRGQGVALVDLVKRLDAFPSPESWSAWMRRPLLEVSARDAKLIHRRLDPIARSPADVVETYGISAADAA
jgi:hypothetical protein